MAAAPCILQHPQSTTFRSGATIFFRVEASGDELHYQWLLDGRLVENGRTCGSAISRDELPSTMGAITPCLVLSNANIAHCGEYKCVVTNAHGSATTMVATLQVKQRRLVDDGGDWDASDASVETLGSMETHDFEQRSNQMLEPSALDKTIMRQFEAILNNMLPRSRKLHHPTIFACRGVDYEPGRLLLLCIYGGNVVGGACLQFCSAKVNVSRTHQKEVDWVEIMALAVAECHQGRGIGSSLVVHIRRAITAHCLTFESGRERKVNVLANVPTGAVSFFGQQGFGKIAHVQIPKEVLATLTLLRGARLQLMQVR
jgi:GNAT superfamily N-acetyltransferase